MKSYPNPKSFSEFVEKFMEGQGENTLNSLDLFFIEEEKYKSYFMQTKINESIKTEII